MIISSVLINDSYLSNKKSWQTQLIDSLQTWSDKNLITCKESEMENYFGLALKKVAEDIMDIFNGKLLFFTVVVLFNYGESFHIKVNLWTCFVFGLLEYFAHDIHTLSILLPSITLR